MTATAQLAVIGGGNMAQAIVFGALDAGLTTPDRVVVCEPDAAKRALFEERGVYSTPSHDRALGRLIPDQGQLLLAVKPQILDGVAAQLHGHIPENAVIITILAGTLSTRVRDALGGKVRVVRAMPNTAARVRQAVTAISVCPGAAKTDAELAKRLFSGLGSVIDIDENLMDAFTAVGGSGPAYVFYLAEAMVRAAIETGFDAQTADSVVRATILGAATMLGHDHTTAPASLRIGVTSKGGTTEAAVGVLEQREVSKAVVEAIVAARDRGRELGR